MTSTRRQLERSVVKILRPLRRYIVSSLVWGGVLVSAVAVYYVTNEQGQPMWLAVLAGIGTLTLTLSVAGLYVGIRPYDALIVSAHKRFDESFESGTPRRRVALLELEAVAPTLPAAEELSSRIQLASGSVEQTIASALSESTERAQAPAPDAPAETPNESPTRSEDSPFDSDPFIPLEPDTADRGRR